MNMTQRDLVTDVAYTQVRQVRLCDRLVHGLVLLDTSQEVALRVLAGHVLVVGVSGRDFERDVGGDDRGVVAHGFEEDDDDAFFFGAALFDFGSAVGSVR